MASTWLRSWIVSTGRRAALCSALVGTLACSEETGVLVSVSRNPAHTPESIDKLEFAIGLGDTESGWIRDAAGSITRDIAGRDLATDPFELLLRDGTQGDTPGRVMVAVLGRTGDQVVAFGAFEEPQQFISGRVVQREIVLDGTNVTVLDTGCVKWEGVKIAAPNDRDCDGDAVDAPDPDCDDHNGAIGPSNDERCDNQVDDDCDGQTDEADDDDGDGVNVCQGDCDDNDSTVHPGAPEVCDSKDNDCNGRCDDGDLDKDEDGYTTCGTRIAADGHCEPLGVPDCRDDVPTIHPEAAETCDGIDQDCDQACDEGLDGDGDGYTACGTVPGGCGLDSAFVDCQDERQAVSPAADEICDGYDSDCDGPRLSEQECYAPNMGGFCAMGLRGCDDDKSDGTFGYAESCVVNDEAMVPSSLCEAYTDCVTAGAPDPLACSREGSATHRLDCTLAVKADGALCPEPRTWALPSLGMEPCSASLLGGITQEHYVVGLTTADGPPLPTAAACQVSLAVVSTRDRTAQPDDVYVVSTATGGEPFVWRFRLTPKVVEMCPTTSALSCVIASP